MRPLWLDFQRPQPGRQRAGLLLLAVGLLASTLLSLHYFSLIAAVDEAQSQISGFQQDPRRQLAAEGKGPGMEARREDAGTIHRTAEQWEALFSSLEHASDDSVTLLGLQPGGRDIQMNGEAGNIAASMDYLKRLQATKGLANVRLTQSEVVMEHPQHPVRFTMAAEWGGTLP